MFHLPFHIDPFSFEIDHHKKILLLGSCFSDEIGGKFHYYAFNFASNPLGTIFHPEPLAQFIESCFDDHSFNRVFPREDIFLTWDAASTIYATSEIDLRSNLSAIRTEWKEKLKTSNYLFVTFGSAWSYRLLEDDQIVANCHKMPGNQFKKELSDLETLITRWKRIVTFLNEVNPELQIVFTVSPVRHSKDGLVANNQSKAILLLLSAELARQKNCHYFPSYELVIDVLRDHRFFKEDLVHPIDQAINFVWKQLSMATMSQSTVQLCDRIEKLRLAKAHRSMHPESSANQDHDDRTQQSINCFLKEHPYLLW
jgi:hypothetical protein